MASSCFTAQKSKKSWWAIAFLLVFSVFFSSPQLLAEYFRPQNSDPFVRAILWGPKHPQSLIDYKGVRYQVSEGMHLDKEWSISEIRRESVLFKRVSSGSFIKVPLVDMNKPRFHNEFSFFGAPISLWEAIGILAKGFGYGVVMHHSAGRGVVPQFHGHNIESFLRKILPAHHRYKIIGSDLLVLPVHPRSEQWSTVLSRIETQNSRRFAVRFPGLSRKGTLLSRGDDIQAVLRQISLGSEVPVQFPRNLHFRVYAMIRNAPFHEILVKVVYLNQCSVVDREEGLEIQPWPNPVQTPSFQWASGTVVAGPNEPQAGWGPSPPPPSPIPGENLIRKSDILPTFKPWQRKSYSSQEPEQ